MILRWVFGVACFFITQGLLAEKINLEPKEELFDLRVEVTAIRAPKGSVRIALYNNEDSWMELPLAHRKQIKPAIKGAMVFSFKGLKKGRYAYAVYHDENNNDELDMQWLPPKPIEGVGTSNNAEGVIGPPNWEDSRFVLDKKLSQSIHLTYM